MNKKINIILASVLCSFNLMAQVDTLTIHKDKVVIDYGRNITHDEREVTGAVSTATSDKLSHKNSINATNQLFGMLPGLQVLQNAGAVWEDGATLYVRGMGTLNS
ncbi:UNVERIFIED_CONTAM: SusC/RagA family TonB-linked outer membrane protein, partial [Bacteroidetes bacterium 56_B9]